MLKLTRQSDYAIVLLALVARRGDGHVFSARELAEASHIPLPMVSKTLKALTKAKLLASVRGTAGGYRLAVDANDTSLAHVLDRIEGPVALTSCADIGRRKRGAAACALLPTCPTSGVWQAINAKLVAALDAVSLAEVAAASTRPASRTYTDASESAPPVPISARAAYLD